MVLVKIFTFGFLLLMGGGIAGPLEAQLLTKWAWTAAVRHGGRGDDAHALAEILRQSAHQLVELGE
jgi:hypothetical protein